MASYSGTALDPDWIKSLKNHLKDKNVDKAFTDSQRAFEAFQASRTKEGQQSVLKALSKLRTEFVRAKKKVRDTPLDQYERPITSAEKLIKSEKIQAATLTDDHKKAIASNVKKAAKPWWDVSQELNNVVRKANDTAKASKLVDDYLKKLPKDIQKLAQDHAHSVLLEEGGQLSPFVGQDGASELGDACKKLVQVYGTGKS